MLYLSIVKVTAARRRVGYTIGGRNHHDYQRDRTAPGVAVCEAVNSPRVKLRYDIYHMHIMEGDIIRAIRHNSGHFGHYHTAGNPGGNELDEPQELYHPPIVQVIAATDYDGCVGPELSPRNGADWPAAPEAAYHVCDV